MPAHGLPDADIALLDNVSSGDHNMVSRLLHIRHGPQTFPISDQSINIYESTVWAGLTATL